MSGSEVYKHLLFNSGLALLVLIIALALDGLHRWEMSNQVSLWLQTGTEIFSIACFVLDAAFVLGVIAVVGIKYLFKIGRDQ